MVLTPGGKNQLQLLHVAEQWFCSNMLKPTLHADCTPGAFCVTHQLTP